MATDRFPPLRPGPAAAPSSHPLGSALGSLVLHALAVLAFTRFGMTVAPENAVAPGRSAPERPAAITLVASPPTAAPPPPIEVVPEETPEEPPLAEAPPQPVDLPEAERLLSEAPRAATLRRVETDWQKFRPEQPAERPDDADETARTVEEPREEEPVEEEPREAPPMEQPPVEESDEPERDEPEEPAEPSAAESRASEASTAEAGAEVDALPRPLPNNAPPEFPPRALAEGREGRVVVAVVVDADGHVDEARVARSSGHEDFDAAAVDAVRRWRFSPARSGRRTVAYEVGVPVNFVRE